MLLETIMASANTIVEQADQVVNKGVSIFDTLLGKQAPVTTTVPTSTVPSATAFMATPPVSTTAPTTTLPELEGPPVSAAAPEVQLKYYFEQFKWPILIGLGLLLWKAR